MSRTKSEDWGRMEEFAFLLVSHINKESEVPFFPNLRKRGNEIDAVICVNHPIWGDDILIEAKNRKKSSPRDVDQILGRMILLNCKYGFLVTKVRMSGKEGQLETIQDINSKGNQIIVPLQGEHIDEFFKSNDSTKNFLENMINIARTHPMKLWIKQSFIRTEIFRLGIYLVVFILGFTSGLSQIYRDINFKGILLVTSVK